MKNPNFSLIILALFFLSFVNAQERKLEFMIGYGVLYSDFFSDVSISGPFVNDYQTPSIGPRVEFSLDYNLGDNKYIGVGYGQHSASTRITASQLYPSAQLSDDFRIIPVENGIATQLRLNDYKITREVRHYNIHFRKKFNSGLHLTFGLFAYQHFESSTNVILSEDGDNLVFNITFRETSGAIDDAGAFGALDYTFPVNSYLEIGARAQIFYSFIGVESITFAPIVRIAL